MASDRDAVMIALTGTPLIGDGYNTKDVFGNYIHKYYYNQSIADGYTLKLIREEIETKYKQNWHLHWKCWKFSMVPLRKRVVCTS